MSNIRTLLAAALLASAGNAVAASSVDLTVKGTITPSACKPSLSNGGVYDIGKLSAKDLNSETFTRLERHTMQFEVSCEAPTLIALESKDNRHGSEFQDDGNFGLGLINGTEKLGSFAVVMPNATADGVPVRVIESMDGGSTWVLGSTLWYGSIASVTNASSITPLPVQKLNIDMNLRPLIAPTKDLTLTSEVPIDGSVTVTVRYL